MFTSHLDTRSRRPYFHLKKGSNYFLPLRDIAFYYRCIAARKTIQQLMHIDSFHCLHILIWKAAATCVCIQNKTKKKKPNTVPRNAKMLCKCSNAHTNPRMKALSWETERHHDLFNSNKQRGCCLMLWNIHFFGIFIFMNLSCKQAIVKRDSGWAEYSCHCVE